MTVLRLRLLSGVLAALHSERAPFYFPRACVYLFVLKIALLSFLRIGCRERGVQFVLTFPSSDRFNVLPDSIC